MNIIETTFEKLPTKFLLIGFEGENLRATVRIDCASVFAEYPNATPSLIVKPLFADAYPVVVDRNGACVDWLITSEILSFNGDGEIQLVFYKDQVICKSAVSKIRVSRSLQVTGEKPDPIARWEDAANQKLAEVDAVIVSIDEMDATAHGLPEGSAPTAEVQMVDDHKRIVLGIPAGATGATGAKGDKGDRGEVGATPQMGIGTVQTLPAGSSATASMSGTTENPLLNLGIPQGDRGVKGDRGEKGDTGATGATGATPDLSIGTVSTLPAGSSATAEITGTAENPVLSLGIPQGVQGERGVQGEKGDPGEGVPAGGLKGQVLAKASDTDRDTKWMYVAPVVKNEASGAIASFADGADGHLIDELKVSIEPVQDLHGYDHPWPGGGGNNQWDEETESGALNTVNGTNLSNNNTIRTKNFISVLAGETYKIVTSEQIWMMFYDSNKEIITDGLPSGASVAANNARNFRNGYTCVMPTGCAFVRWYFRTEYGTTYKNDTALNYPSTASTYSPYSNICPITGWDGVKVTRTGKNFVDPALYEFAERTFNGLTYTVQNDGTVKVNGTSSAIGGPGLTKRFLVPPGTYVRQETAGSGVFCTYRYALQETGGSTYTLPNPFVSTGKEWVYINLYCTEIKEYDNVVLYPQLELGSTTSDFEPYAGNTYDITLPSESGTVYGGELTIAEDGSGVLTVTKESLVFDSSAWSFLSNFFYKANTVEVGKNVSGYYTTENGIMMYLNSNNGQARIYLADNDFLTSESDVGSMLNGYKLLYELATPITYTLTASEIRTLLGQNHIWSDAGDVSVKYDADTKLYIDNKITQAIAAALNS